MRMAHFDLFGEERAPEPTPDPMPARTYNPRPFWLWLGNVAYRLSRWAHRMATR